LEKREQLRLIEAAIRIDTLEVEGDLFSVDTPEQLEQARAIAAAAARLDPGQVEAALALLASCAARRAKLVVSGVGKSGIVARKIAATFSSLSLMAIFLHPGDVLHGDMGIMAADDVVLLLSNWWSAMWMACSPMAVCLTTRKGRW